MSSTRNEPPAPQHAGDLTERREQGSGKWWAAMRHVTTPKLAVPEGQGVHVGGEEPDGRWPRVAASSRAARSMGSVRSVAITLSA